MAKPTRARRVTIPFQHTRTLRTDDHRTHALSILVSCERRRSKTDNDSLHTSSLKAKCQSRFTIKLMEAPEVMSSISLSRRSIPQEQKYTTPPAPINFPSVTSEPVVFARIPNAQGVGKALTCRHALPRDAATDTYL